MILRVSLKFWILISLILHVLASYFSVGYRHYDEHFQVLEFAGYKLGLTPKSALAWEFTSQIRSWFFPGVLYALAKILTFFGYQTASDWNFALQFVLSITGWASTLYLYITLIQAKDLWKPDWWSLNKDTNQYKQLLFQWMALFWFLPFFHARTSSENFSTSLWVIGFCLLLRAHARQGLVPLPSEHIAESSNHAAEKISEEWSTRTKGQDGPTAGRVGHGWPSIPMKFFPQHDCLRSLLSGCFMGLAFLTRFQTCLLTLGVIFWMIFENFTNRRGNNSKSIALLKQLSCIGLGLIFAFGFGACLDHWGYDGVWTNTAWNYFRVNLLEHRANSFGVTPWWDYFKMLWEQLPLGLGFLVPAIFILGCLLSPTHPLTWAALCFALVHFCIGHKEMRFLFVLAPFFPIFLVRVASLLSFKEEKYLFVKRFCKWTYAYLLIASTLLLFPAVFKAEKNYFHWYHYIAKHFPDNLHLVGWSPEPFQDILPIYFYRPRNYRYTQVQTPQQLAQLIQVNHQIYVFRDKTKTPTDYWPIVSQCKLVYEVFSPAYAAIDFNHWLSRAGNWGLFDCRSELPY